MAIREDLVASAAKFLQDPSVASSPVEKKVAFLQAKNLTQEEVSAALAQAGAAAPAQPYTPQTASAVAQPPQYYGQYPPQYPPYGWQQPPPQPVPRRDWRDWFIMATVVSGVSYGLYSLGKRYVYPLVSPPTPERLEQDKKSIDEQFEKTFALVDQLAKDTEALKTAEKERTERLDTALTELETTISELKAANKRRDDESQRVRDDVQNLKDSIPRGLNNQRDLTDTRMREVNAELKSLKTLITQRMNPTATSTSISNFLRPAASGNATPAPAESASAETKEEPKPAAQGPLANAPRASPFSSGMQAKASIPAWQMMASKSAESASTPAVNGTDAESSSGTQEASGSA
ncbi:peroxisomal membrane anchor protein conserved region-domain-containing protein [Parachaetomium inaequale]|uniref:Peroxisomal membrane protein PEX14 n=1 Tax=Parachaetomium inaequale TaxID=2588326 RepID=A0AAN6PLB2_9PEZI|nr:peroxisomal membrane anchor protein conserved region-domain-containing protein [Parachaetomium inaequale]